MHLNQLHVIQYLPHCLSGKHVISFQCGLPMFPLMLESSPHTTNVITPYPLTESLPHTVWLYMIFIMFVTFYRLFMISIWPRLVDKHLPVHLYVLTFLPYMYFTVWECANVQAERVQRLKTQTAPIFICWGPWEYKFVVFYLELKIQIWITLNIIKSHLHKIVTLKFQGMQ